MMLIILVIRRVMNSLRQSFLQRLISLVVSTLLAISLVSTTIVLAPSLSEQKVASHVSSQSVLPVHLSAPLIQGFLPNIDQQATAQYAREGRLL
jgi:uncharacterized membrane protein required for colicin V production